MANGSYLSYRPSTGTAHVPQRNVGTIDRWLAGLFAVRSFRRFGKRHGALGKIMAVVVGVILAKKAFTGRSRLYRALGVSSAKLKEGAGIGLTGAITIRRPKMEVYEFWREVTNLPLFMRHLESVTRNPNGTTHWKVRGPRDIPVEWDAEIINEDPGRFIAWRSMPGSTIQHAGSVHFHDAGDRGTELLVRMRYDPPGLAPGFAVAKLLHPITEAELAEDLTHLKHTMETGIDITTEGQPHGAPLREVELR